MILFSETKCIKADSKLSCIDCEENVCSKCAIECHAGHDVETLSEEDADTCECNHFHPNVSLYIKSLKAETDQLSKVKNSSTSSSDSSAD